jgi:hypothetical protein
MFRSASEVSSFDGVHPHPEENLHFNVAIYRNDFNLIR